MAASTIQASRGSVALQNVPVWVRVVAGMAVMLLVAWSLLVYLVYNERRDGAIADAREFAASANQLAVASITGMMITGVAKQRGVFVDQVRNSEEIKDLRVLR